ncbi:MAG: methionine adenosyltransferase [Eubacteriales bacterium]|nr:methionine adenosyltransferase [Eubacteriales bacterium]
MLFSAEQVSNGHPDKICDQISDRIVTDFLKHDKDARVASETAIKNYKIFLFGEYSSNYTPNFHNLVKEALLEIGLNNIEKYEIIEEWSKQSQDIANGVDRSIKELQGAGDQGMMFGYATDETKEYLPFPYILATKALLKLREYNLKNHFSILKPDAKAQVTFDYKNNKIDTFLISTQHDEKVELEEIKNICTNVMKEVALEYNLNVDFNILVNPTGRFIIGSSFGDSGLTGRKIIADTYGSAVPHGGGAFSGKDPSKVDRSAAYMARKISKDIVKEGIANKCSIQLAYAIGMPEPLSIWINCFNSEKEDLQNIEKKIRKKYDLTPYGIINYLNLLNVDYNLTSSYGHFGKEYLPWEK